ncbi:hypothetical protein CDAR_299211 [Caerostris darwini]|uniref:PID domain-containing protein n=1 Tax=Caerostris darwini TaxID=1538125 RepID=A0AAV4PDG7_9ARAC|nr:hypothetical protein CDAR_299211 [Caerostris darwini]
MHFLIPKTFLTLMKADRRRRSTADIRGQVPWQSRCQRLMGHQAHAASRGRISSRSTIPTAWNDLALSSFEVSGKGVHLSAMPQNQNQNYEPGLYPIESISYGVQDLVYTRVFAMIVVRDSGNMLEKHPFLCHAFVCDSRQNARSLTLTLAKAFQDYSRSVKGLPPPRKFAIDLRSQEEIQADLDIPQESHA